MTARLRLAFRILAWTIALVVAAGAAIVAVSEWRWRRTFDAPYPAISASRDPDVIARGEYLVYGAAACAYCHVPREEWPALAQGAHLPLTGHHRFPLPFGEVYSANITPDPQTGIGRRTDGELARVLRSGVRADGRAAVPLMTLHLSDEDLTAVISFLRAQLPVAHAVPEHRLNRLGKILMSFSIEPAAPSVPPPHKSPVGPSVERGQYLANDVSSCAECHTNRGRDGRLVGPPFGGGQRMDVAADPTRVFVAPNLTPDPAGPVGLWPEDVFVRRFRQGEQQPGTPMPWGGFGHMTDDDLRSILSLPADAAAVVASDRRTCATKGRKVGIRRAPAGASRHLPPGRRPAQFLKSGVVSLERFPVGRSTSGAPDCGRADPHRSKNGTEPGDRGLGDRDPSRARQDDRGAAPFFRLFEPEGGTTCDAQPENAAAVGGAMAKRRKPAARPEHDVAGHRPTWKGSLKLSLIQIPIRVYPATTSTSDVHFRQLHRKCHTPIQLKKWCPHCEEEVSNEDIVRGYEDAKGEYVLVEDEEIAKLRPESTRTIDLSHVIDAASITPIHVERSYYLTPDTKAAGAAFAVMRDALGTQAAIGRFALHGREYLVAVKALDEALVMYTLRTAGEVRDLSATDGLEFAAGKTRPEEVKLARQVLGSLKTTSDLSAFTDRYEEALREMIASKAGEAVVTSPEAERPAKVVDLMDALRRSLATIKETGGAAGARGARVLRHPGGRRASGRKARKAS